MSNRSLLEIIDGLKEERDRLLAEQTCLRDALESMAVLAESVGMAWGDKFTPEWRESLARAREVAVTALSQDAGKALLERVRLRESKPDFCNCPECGFQSCETGTQADLLAIEYGLRAQLAAFERVVEAARHVSRGCDCEHDYRCSSCQRVLDLRAALAALEKGRVP